MMGDEGGGSGGRGLDSSARATTPGLLNRKPPINPPYPPPSQGLRLPSALTSEGGGGAPGREGGMVGLMDG